MDKNTEKSFVDKMLGKIYRFLFIDRVTAFYRVCLLLLIPAALSQEFCRAWMIVLLFLQTLVLLARFKGWNKEE